MLYFAGALVIAAEAALPKSGTTYTVVEGSRYRVTVRGDEVEVAKKATFVRFNMQERDRLRAAVKQATGCRIVDELAPSAKLRGKLACAPG